MKKLRLSILLAIASLFLLHTILASVSATPNQELVFRTGPSTK